MGQLFQQVCQTKIFYDNMSTDIKNIMNVNLKYL